MFLKAATLRQETMYGQAKAWALPKDTEGLHCISILVNLIDPADYNL